MAKGAPVKSVCRMYFQLAGQLVELAQVNKLAKFTRCEYFVSYGGAKTLGESAACCQSNTSIPSNQLR